MGEIKANRAKATGTVSLGDSNVVPSRKLKERLAGERHMTSNATNIALVVNGESLLRSLIDVQVAMIEWQRERAKGVSIESGYCGRDEVQRGERNGKFVGGGQWWC